MFNLFLSVISLGRALALLMVPVLLLTASCKKDEEPPAPTYTVTFNTNGGSNVKPQNITDKGEATEPKDPTRAGYDFAGWYTDEALSNEFDFDTPITQDITLYAKWDIKTYTVTFNTNGGTTIAPVKVEKGKKATPPGDPTKTDHTFAGWYTNSSLSSAFDFDTSITKNITLYARWEEVMVTYTGSIVTGLIEKYDKVSNLHLKIPASINGVAMTTIAAGAFKYKENITALTIAEGITTIDNSSEFVWPVFPGAYNAFSGVGAFYGCKNIKGNLTLPHSLTKIGHEAFAHCSGFTGSLTIPDKVTEIGHEAFAHCSGFTGSLTIPNSVTEIGVGAFAYCSGFTGSLTIPNSVTEIWRAAFRGCSGFTGSLTIPNSVTEINAYAFAYCSGFTGSLTIPNSVTRIGYFAFEGCSGFTGSLTIPNSVTRIDGGTFLGCSGFTGSLTIPNSVTFIFEHAFDGCSGFTGSLTIPNSVTFIRWAAFDNTPFTTVLALPNRPPKLSTARDPIFTSNVTSIQVPAGSVAAYKAADGWRDYRDIITARQ